jgi:hypothetical protein
MAASYLPSVRKATPDHATIDLYKTLDEYYYNSHTLCPASPHQPQQPKSTEQERLQNILTLLYNIDVEVAPLEYFELLNFIDDTKRSNGLHRNKSAIEKKIDTLKAHVEHLKLSPECQLQKQLRIPLSEGTTQECVEYRIRETRKELKDLYTRSEHWNAFESPTRDEIAQKETELNALLFHFYYSQNTTNSGATPMALQQRNFLVNQLQQYKDYPAARFMRLDYCAILNKIDLALTGGKLIEENYKLIQEIQADITNLQKKIVQFSASPEGQLKLAIVQNKGY